MGFCAVSNSRLSKAVNLLTILLPIPSLSRQIDKYLGTEKKFFVDKAKLKEFCFDIVAVG